MGLGDEAQHLSGSALLIEEYLAREQRAGRLQLPLKKTVHRRALLHGHCHQKAFDTMGAVASVLKMVPDLEVEVVESSCCGMAGSFGYESAHYDISIRWPSFLCCRRCAPRTPTR
jgi:Fe-S oxidoreductase